MYATIRLLLAVFAYVATASNGIFTYELVGITGDAKSEIDGAMSGATLLYSQKAPMIPSEHIKVYYDSNLTQMHGSRIHKSITFPQDEDFWVEGYAIAFMSRVFGVGTTDVWDRRCPNGVLNNFTALYKVFHGFEGVKPDAIIRCDQFHSDQDSFQPYGLHGYDEFDPDDENRHMLMVQAMVAKDGLQQGKAIH